MSFSIIFLLFCCSFLVVVVIAGYIRFKSPKYKADSWEEGNRQILVSVISFIKKYIVPILYKIIKDFITTSEWLITQYLKWWKKTSINKDIKDSLYLSDNEYNELVKQLKDNPFVFPKLGIIYQKDFENGILRFDVDAIGLTSKYRDIDNKTLREIICTIIKNYYMETRNTNVSVYVTVASPIRVQIAIPLSDYGKYLLQKEVQPQMGEAENTLSDYMEEEIDFKE